MFDGHMSVVLLNKLHFLRHPRTGSTAVSDALKSIGGKQYGPALHQYYPAPNGEHQFTTVRNPFDVLTTWFIKDNRCATILDYLKSTPPSRLFYMADKVDFVMLYEDLQRDFDKVMQLVGLEPLVLPRVNVTAGKGLWPTYWNNESRLVAIDQYEEDFKIYWDRRG